MSSEPIMLRPTFPNDQWFVEEQINHSNAATTTFVRNSKIHPAGQYEKVYIIFVEFNPNYSGNQGRDYAFSVRGGRNAKPNENIHRFATFEHAKKYVDYMIEETEKHYSRIESEESWKKYVESINQLKTRLS